MNVSDSWHVLADDKKKVSSNRVLTTRLSGSFNTAMENLSERGRKSEREMTSIVKAGKPLDLPGFQRS